MYPAREEYVDRLFFSQEGESARTSDSVEAVVFCAIELSLQLSAAGVVISAVGFAGEATLDR